MLSSIDLKTIKLNKINIHVIDDKGFHPFPIFALILSGHCWEALKKGQGITVSSFLYFLYTNNKLCELFQEIPPRFFWHLQEMLDQPGRDQSKR